MKNLKKIILVVKNLFFLFSINSFNDCPEINEIYPGIKGKTHGDKKLTSPAPKEIKYSIILKY